jgi:hypothetical protein
VLFAAVAVVVLINYVLILYGCCINLVCCGKVLSFCHKGLIFLRSCDIMWKCVFAIIFVVLSKCGLAMHCTAVLCCYAVTDVVLCSHVVMYYVLMSFLKVVYCVHNFCGKCAIVMLYSVELCCYIFVAIAVWVCCCNVVTFACIFACFLHLSLVE